MEYLIIILVALFVAGLTFFSGFGLGTLLMPAFALFFPIEVAIAATAVVHLANNIFKIFLIGKHTNFNILARFAIPAAIFAAVGAYLLSYLSKLEPIFEYTLFDSSFFVEPIKLIVAILMGIFAYVELTPKLKDLSIDQKYIPFGGVLSGFFGGLSGHQGALRTAFLIHAGLEKKAFIGTMVSSAVLIDVSRLIIYGTSFFAESFSILSARGSLDLILYGSLAAFVGSAIGRYLLEKVTFDGIQRTVAVMLVILAIGLAAGII
ncbi:MAG: sulfite exporter TauE/SafE family protein [Melioribacteraceae bacterium]|nr:sulfite exporter TauE/SafE family protein [Melioribacteraceae bacterium]MCF8263114.1 sulfite exporter TauE/SafE family protein [Melioribacteraceae bacterium]MCF8430554.1 sulfite exporter TauE/SafE family protein [Melioribacteraceae bacterium]